MPTCMQLPLGPHDLSYVFLDIVRFTSRSVEDQSAIIAALNGIVQEAIPQARLGPISPIYLPTGDGVCIALAKDQGEYDTPLALALAILSGIRTFNAQLESFSPRRFQIRIGINENRDNVVQDINGRKNIAGAGINMAQRIMNLGDACQILVGSSVYNVLRNRDSYRNAFRSFRCRDKNGEELAAYQYLGKNTPELSRKIPSRFFWPDAPIDGNSAIMQRVDFLRGCSVSMPGNPWVIHEKANSQFGFRIPHQAPFAHSIEILNESADKRFTMEQEILLDGEQAADIVFAIRPSASAVVGVKVDLMKRDATTIKSGWLLHRPYNSSLPREPERRRQYEWTLWVNGDSLGDGWLLQHYPIVTEFQHTFGKEGWQMVQIRLLRLYNSMCISPISFYRT